MTVKNFKELFKQNTGTHPLDSGGKSGRSWQKGPIGDGPIAFFDKKYSEGTDFLSVTIETARLLDETFSIDQDLIEKCEKAGFDTIQEFLEDLGFIEVSAYNPYNGENDLSQVFAVRVYSRDKDKDLDYLYSSQINEGKDGINDVVVTLAAHNGADVRGGYSDAVPILSNGDYSCPVDVTAGFYVSKAFDENGETIDKDDLSVSPERWEVGYSSSPIHEFSNDIAKVLSVSDDGQEAIVLLKSGEKVIVHPHVRF